MWSGGQLAATPGALRTSPMVHALSAPSSGQQVPPLPLSSGVAEEIEESSRGVANADDGSHGDDSLGMVLPEASSSGGGRAHTPEKQRPKSISNRARPQILGVVSEVEEGQGEIPSMDRPRGKQPRRPKMKVRGRRAERRWRNDNFIGTGLLRVLARETAGGESLLEELAENEPIVQTSPGYFSMLRDNAALARDFERCRTKPAESNVKANDPGVASECWLRVERRIRKIILRELKRIFTPFITNAEAIILAVMDRKKAITEEDAMMDELCSMPILSSSPEGWREATFHFRKPLHRLLVHGICRFHGFHSVSIDDDNDNDNGTRDTQGSSRRLTKICGRTKLSHEGVLLCKVAS